jgi:hypothetical protein
MTTKQARRARDAGISRAVTHADRAHDGWAAEARAIRKIAVTTSEAAHCHCSHVGLWVRA